MPADAWKRSSCALLLLATVAVGCELAVTADVALHADGSGTVRLILETDPQLTRELDALRVDPFAETLALPSIAPAWRVSRAPTDGGGEQVVLVRETDSPQELTTALRDLTAGVTDDDPSLDLDLDLALDAEGAAALTGTAGLRLPATPGVRGADIDEGVVAMLADGVRAQLQVRLPGPVVRHDADRLADGALVWDLPAEGSRSVVAVSEPPAPVPWTLVAAGAVLVVVAATVWWRLRRGRRAQA